MPFPFRSGPSPLLSLAACVGAALVSSLAHAAVTANRVVGYATGSPVQSAWWDPSRTFTNGTAALGLPDPVVGSDPFTGLTTGALTPFNAPFDPDDIVRVSSGGKLELELSSPVAVGPGKTLGVFTNNMLLDVTPGTTFNTNYPFEALTGGTGTAKTFTLSPTELLLSSAVPQAMVYVKAAEGDAWVAVDDEPIAFDMPTNYYTDVLIDKLVAPQGTAVVDFSKPFGGTLADFAGKTYSQILELLDGSAGGTWLDLSGTGLSEVRYVKFEVPAGADYRMIIDAVTAVPEPTTVALLPVALALALRRRHRR